jgi:hypothetical protein
VTRYFLHICRQDGMILDPDGGELPSLAEAKVAAIEGLRELLAEAVRYGTKFDTTGISIENEAGEKLASVSLRDALPEQLLATLTRLLATDRFKVSEKPSWGVPGHLTQTPDQNGH